MERKPVIGVTPLFDEDKESYWMLPGYMEGIQAAGGLPVMLPFVDAPGDVLRLAPMLDGLLLTGGHDVNPTLYGATPTSSRTCPARDRMEYAWLDAMLAADKPILGICRGIQLLNVYLGGTLWQDISAERAGSLAHVQKPPYDKPLHTVKIGEDTPLFGILAKTVIAVNSYHHQGIKALAEGLKPMARSGDDLIEAVYIPEKSFALAVQWHPEFSYKTDESQLLLFKAFTQACLL